jgi:hypothetical protein
MLREPNPDGRGNVDVLRRTANGQDITGRMRGDWVIDFGVAMPESEAALYEAPFERVRALVKPFRQGNRRAAIGSGGGCTWSRGPDCARRWRV